MKKGDLEWRALKAVESALHLGDRPSLDKAWELIEQLLYEGPERMVLVAELSERLVKAGKGLRTYRLTSTKRLTTPCHRVLSKLGEWGVDPLKRGIFVQAGVAKGPVLEAAAKKAGLPVVEINTDSKDAKAMAVIELTADVIEDGDYYNPHLWQRLNRCLVEGQPELAATCIEKLLSAMPRYYPPLSAVPHCREVLAKIGPYSSRRFKETQEMHRAYLDDEFEELARILAGRMGMSYAVLTLQRDHRNWTADVHFSSQQPTLATVVSTTGYCTEGTTALQALTKALERYKAVKEKFGK